MTWRLHHAEKARSVKVHHHSYFAEDVQREFASLPHSIRHTVLRPAFWLGLTLGFPLEHLLWEKAPVFSTITRLLGL